ncbi:ATP-dependent DNA helicase [Pholiota conissans]|uniref:ATP-dependent DNA helicase n=1 Tax=Pholiota conissans TaxID=109636 RepID=A0A9P5ZEP1_9AGAR|nr:ATP-dependent DNA helicase [Pholiota conissans]
MYDSPSHEDYDASSPGAGPSRLRPNQPKAVKKESNLDASNNDPEECMRVLTEVFGHNSFKGKQKEIIEAAYMGKDVLVVAPTGMGKSLCFQVPAIADKRGISIVVSPLLALMQNQIDYLCQKNIEVASLSSQVAYRQQQEVIRQLQLYDAPIKLLYITPERLCTADFTELLDKIYENHNFNRLVVDEAHCISEWGHDFRAEYRRIGKIRERYPNVPIMALTATATDAVRQDIILSLGLDKNRLFIALHPFNRANLFYEARYLSNPQPQNQMKDIFEYITSLYQRRGKASSGLIYCRYRKTCDELSEFLRGRGLNARPYHRGIPSATLEKTLKGWTNCEAGEPGAIDLVIATIAFGMGIDKGDVRYIIHYDLPKSLEGYYQETGRAGRDGFPSKCILYYSREDAIRVKQFVHSSNSARMRDDDEAPTPTQRASNSLQSLIELVEDVTTCRHVSICRYFGEKIDETDANALKTYCDRMCDVCKYPEKTKLRFKGLSSSQDARQNIPVRQSHPSTHSAHGSSKDHNTNDFVKRSGRDGLQSGNSFGGQKRAGSTITDGAPKKLKVGLVPALVTKPFSSTSGLSKPFKAPTFVGAKAPVMKGSRTPSIVYPPSRPAPKLHTEVQSRRSPSPQDLSLDMDTLEEEPVDEEEVSPSLDLPLVNLLWEADFSAKVSPGERKQQFESLRRSLHRTLVLPFDSDQFWSKVLLSTSTLDETQRNEIVFSTATELELSAISLSSTLDGYNSRIRCIKDDIKKLSDVQVWDSDDGDLEDVQDIIKYLRRAASSKKNKGKRTAR